MIGRTLAHYRIVGALGAGGMGEVYRATDLRLGREVAIKTLPEEFASDPGRAARFEHEARTLASLSHPHIASLYGLEEAEGRRFLVMELVEGLTLAERIARGALPIEEALALASQIAAALEAAHERGIVHRDLKPANVKVTSEGNVKVLDFGLAKALADETSPTSASLSPTLTAAATRAGVILGTAAYMSPEQARGQKIDRRSDVWAFGCVLYEMLSGRQAFGGETVSDSISQVLMREPDWTALPPGTPAAVRRLLRRCLEKKADRRLRDLGDARLEIEEAAAAPGMPGAGDEATPAAGAGRRGEPGPGRRTERVAVGVLALVATAAIGYAIRSATVASPPAPIPVRRLAVPLAGNPGVLNGRFNPTLAADGSRLAYISMKDGQSRVAVRPFDRPEAFPVAGTEGAMMAGFSPDGRQVAFYSGNSLSTVSLDGGAAIHVADLAMNARICWTPEGSLIFSPAYDKGLSIVPAAGGTPVTLTTPQTADGELGHWHATLLPDGRSVMFTVFRKGGPGASRIELVDLKTHARRVLVEKGYDARYESGGHLLFARGDELYAAPFDAVKNELTGEPILVLQGIQVDAFNGIAQYDISSDGTLVYLPAAELMRRLAWREPDGTIRTIVGETRPFMYPSLSPDGRTIAVSIFERGESDVWLADVERGVLSRLTNRPQTDFLPVWSPDGRRLAFVSDDRAFTLYTVAADGSAPPELLLDTPRDKMLGSWSPDGRTIAYTETIQGGKDDLRLLDVASPGSSRPLFPSSASESAPKISPDGRRVVFTSDESGKTEVYVGAIDGPGGKTRVSTGGGTEARWAPDGSAIFYRSGDAILSVSLGAGPDPRPQAPKVVFTDPLMPEGWARKPNYDVGRDGRSFVIIENATGGEASLQVVLNFSEELKRRVPTGGR